MFKSQGELARAQKIAQIGSWTWDILTDEISWSDESYRIYGLDHGEVDPTYELFLSFIIPEDRERVNQEVQKAIENGHKYNVTYNIIRKDGVPRIILSENDIITDESGRVIRMYGTNQDITDRKKEEKITQDLLEKEQQLTEELTASNEELQSTTEELQAANEELRHQGDELLLANHALRQSQEDMNRAQEVGQIGSWRLDVRRNILTWSDENYRIFGVPNGTPMTYETFLGIVHLDDRQYVDTQWKAGLAGEPYDIEHRIVVGEQVKWVREKAYLEFDDEGHSSGRIRDHPGHYRPQKIRGRVKRIS